MVSRVRCSVGDGKFMTWEAWITLIVLGGMIGTLARDIVPPSVAVIGAVVLLLVSGVVTPVQAFSGFSNPAPITVAALYVLSRAVQKTRALQPFVSKTLGASGSQRWALARLLTPAAAASAFLNNTPIVAMLVPQVTSWAQQNRRSPSRYLMPLSFAAIFGGMVTLIGTSTNLVVSGLLIEGGDAPLSMFELTPVGLPIAVLGIVALLLLSPKLLPDRRPARADLSEEFREFVVRMTVISGGPLDGQTVEGGHLRHLRGVFLVELVRGNEVIAPVAPDTVLRGHDVLTFVGRVDDVVDVQSTGGLVSSEHKHVAEFDTTRHTFFEVVLGATSPLVGQTLKEAGFRSRYQGAVVAIHRAGRRVHAKLGGVHLKVGDTLLVLSDEDFENRWRERGVFLLVSSLGGVPPAATKRAPVVGAVLVGFLLCATIGILPILHAALLGAFVLVLLGVLTPAEARQAVDIDVILVIAGAFGLAAALQVTGLAELAATALVAAFGELGPRGALFGIVVMTISLISVITNNAAAVLVFPIAMSMAADLNLEQRPFAIAVAVAASASFLTPVAYQTNLMVYGPGGYRFTDYTRLGLPLTMIVIAVTVVLVPIIWSLR